MASPIFALVDCNNFFCSCERVFNPKLAKLPVAVLSSNDGCIIARSQEVKDLGIPMGAPYHLYKDKIKSGNVQILSCNFQLYGDMSNRIMSILSQFTPDMEVYSVDEAFLKLDGFKSKDLVKYCEEIRSTILKWTGIPVSIGIGQTKTLAKVANCIAKKSKQKGVFDIRAKEVQHKALESFKIEDLWGVGRKFSVRFRMLGIDTAQQLRNVDTKWIRTHYSVVGERMIRELNGMSCLEISEIKPNKTIISSKSFGKYVTDIESLSEAISTYTARASEKMRKQNSKAMGIYIYIRTNTFSKIDKQYSNGISIGFEVATCDTSALINAALKCLNVIFRDGYKYKKAGIMLFNLVSANTRQNDFFAEHDDPKREALMRALDDINFSIKRNIIGMAAQGIKKPWLNKCDLRSPRYTTHWDELIRTSN
jgi:DNA polymerase V